MTLTEKIKQKGKTSEEIVDWLEDQFTNRPILREIYEKLCKKRWILQDDVLALLDGYQRKWQEIVEHIQNQPDVIEPKPTFQGCMKYAELIKKWVEVLEAKVAEAAKEEVEN